VTNEWRIVLDTSVLVSAVLLPKSVPRQAFDLAMTRGGLLVSIETIAELEDVLRRPKFEKYIVESQRLEFLAALLHVAEPIEVSEVVNECRNAKDNKFLELALSGNASHIISGDADLLVLHPFRGIEIVTPQLFLSLADE
jgi:putative PIN family toxin of toxin-antitoxin system